MKLSEFTIESIHEFISGDNKLTPYLKGSELISLFKSVGLQEIITSLESSRNIYVREKLIEINGTNMLSQLLEKIFDPRHFIKNPEKNITDAIDRFNPLILQEGYKIELVNGKYKVININNPTHIETDVYFENIQNRIIEQINDAKFTIWIAVAWFTDNTIFNSLVEKKKKGLNIQIALVDDDTNRKSGLQYQSHFETYWISPNGIYQNIMHHKFCIIDLYTVIHGSYNWTNKAQWNQENITIDKNRDIAEKFALEFLRLKTPLL
jgi:phosphatidylserine/phosphatidylglycerophosphate/cardiolipin synthase-like enzyme